MTNTSDARFFDANEKPIRLLAMDGDDLAIISTLVQDAIAERKEMRFEKKAQRFSLLLKRFRWEDAQDAKAANRPFERVQSVLSFGNVLNVKTNGLPQGNDNLVFDLLGLELRDGQILIALAGEGSIALEIEAIEVQLVDVSKPYRAASQLLPHHEGQD